jgi:hypothetical protein
VLTDVSKEHSAFSFKVKLLDPENKGTVTLPYVKNYSSTDSALHLRRPESFFDIPSSVHRDIFL